MLFTIFIIVAILLGLALVGLGINILFRKNKIYQRYISWGFRYNISENSIDIIYKTDDIFMDFDWIAWHGMFF